MSLNYEPQDDEPSVRILPMYRAAIGDAIFPGDDIHTLQLRSDFSEMLLHHLNGGGDFVLTAIGAALAEFTPARVSTTTHPVWKDKVAEEWDQRERPRIFAAMEAFFLDGGLERRMGEQRAFFAALHAAGVRFGNTHRLFDHAAHAGDWRKAFIELAAMGRDQGIQLSSNDIDRPGVAAAMHGAGFSRVQQRMIWSNLLETKHLEEAPPSTALRRRLGFLRPVAAADNRDD